jgi:hypothetical protein
MMYRIRSESQSNRKSNRRMEATEIDRESIGDRHPAYAVSYVVHALGIYNLHLTGVVNAFKCKFTISEITDKQEEIPIV